MTVSTFLIGSEDTKLYSMTDGVKRPTKNIPLGEVIQWVEYDPIWKHRGKAVQGYADLERALCMLLVTLSGMSWETAVTIFYKITNTQARNGILEKLLHKKCGTKFNPFWNPFAKDLRILDLERNKIVHWVAAANV